MSTVSVPSATDLETLAVNALRILSAEAVQEANSGHPGMPMGCAPMAYALWRNHLRFNPANPDWANRDRFVLSAGHGSALLYSLLHLTGFDLSLDDIRNFRQWNSRTPGHPEYGHTPGVETTTGPLGQGFGNAVGMALAEARLAAEFNRDGHDPVDHYTYVIAGDGDIMEGVQAEAASLAGHLGLGKLIVLYDDNNITIDGTTDIAFSEDVRGRFAAYGWQTELVADGTDVQAIDRAIGAAKAAADRPSLIAVRTRIGHGSPNRENTSKAHGEPLGDEELALTKQSLGWTAEGRFQIPPEVLAHFREALERGAESERAWQVEWDTYAAAHTELAAEFGRRTAGELPASWDADLPDFATADGPMATRAASGKVLNAIASRVPELMGGSADLAGSNKTLVDDGDDFSRDNRAGRNVHFGIREHAMGAIMNGMTLHGGLRPYGATFLIFSDYMRPAVRLAALMQVPATYVYTHDSIAVGEDGPTHQPIEQIASLRAMPGLTVIRPSDANETREAWAVAMAEPGPVALMLTRQKLPIIEGDATALRRGAYILQDVPNDEIDVILIATGSEVHVAAEAAGVLAAEGLRARVVSMPSWELFERQDQAYREHVLPPGVSARVSVEAGVTFGWSRYVGDSGGCVGIDRFGASAPGSENLQQFGFTVENVVQKARAICGR